MHTKRDVYLAIPKAIIPPANLLDLSFRYLRSVARKGKAKDMFPPGRVMFLRPIKLLQDRDQARDKRNEGYKQKWDCIWITPQELIGEGILISPKVRALRKRRLWCMRRFSAKGLHGIKLRFGLVSYIL